MKAKHLTLTLLVFIVLVPTIGSIYQLIAGNGQYASTSSSTLVSISPVNTTVYTEIGTTFSVNVTTTNVTDLYVWQAGISFNATILEALSFEEGPFLKQKGATLWINATIDNDAGIIHYHASALAGDITGVNGSGVLGTITFRTRNYGNSAIQLTDVILLDSHLADIDRTLVHGTAKVRIPGDANGNRTVDMYDLYALGRAYGLDSSKLGWNPDCDFNIDGKIDYSDLTILNTNYGRTS